MALGPIKGRSRQPGWLFGKLSIRQKIAFALLLSFVFTLPSAILSLLYLTSLSDGINTIVGRDVTLGRQVSELKLIMLDIQREERDYIMSGNNTDRSGIENNIDRARTIIAEIQTIVPVDDRNAVDVLLNYLVVYSNTFNILVEYVTSNPPQAVASSDQPVLPVYIRENLDNSRQSFLDAARAIEDKSWSYMEAHKEFNLRLDARARRNIIVVLIITSIMCILIVTYFPRLIVKPITSLKQSFRKAEAGDFDAKTRVQSKDEIGDLVVSYNQMMSRLKKYDELKTIKITTQKRSIDRLLENIYIPVCILTENLRATYYNTLFVNLFGSSVPPKAPDLGLEITKIPEMDELVKELKTNINQARNTFVYRHTCQNGSVQVLKGQLVRDHVMNLISIILVGVTEKNAGGGS